MKTVYNHITATRLMFRSFLWTVLLSATVTGAQAATQTWTGSSSGTWNSAGNWSTTTPASTDTAVFNGAGNGNTAVTVSTATVNSITFDTANAAAYVIGTSAGGTLTLGSTGTIQTTSTVANVENFSATLALAGGYTFSSNSSTTADTLDFSGPIALGANTLTLAGSNTGTNTISGAIGGTGGVTQSGAGLWILSGSNGYTGATAVGGGLGGELEIAASSGGSIVGGKALTVTAGTFDYNSTGTVTSLTTGAVTAGVGTDVIEADGTGTLSIGAVTNNVGGILDLVTTNGATIAESTSTLTPNGQIFYNGQYIANTGTSTAVSALVYAAVGSTNTFTGGTNTYTTTTVASGTSVAPVAYGQYLFNGSGTFSSDTGNGVTAAWISSLNSAATDTLTIASGRNIISGLLVNGTSTSTGLNVTVKGAGYFAGLSSGGGIVAFATMGSKDVLTLNVGLDCTNNTGDPATLIKTGLGTLILNGTSNYSGATYVDQGTLEATTNNNTDAAGTAQSGGSLGFGGWMGVQATYNKQGQAFVAPGAALDLDSTASAITIDEAVTLTNGSLLNNASSGTATLDNGIAGLTETNGGSGSQASGTVTLTATNGSGSGATGTVVAMSSGSITTLGLTNAGTGYTGSVTASFTYSGGSTTTTATATVVQSALVLNGTSNSVGGTGGLTINAVVANGSSVGGFTKIGTDTLTLTGSNTYTGGTIINAGKVYVGSYLTSNGSTGTGAVTINNTGSLYLATSTTAAAVTVNSGGTFGGLGTSGAVTLNSGGTINLIDGTVGTLHIGSLSTTGGGTIDFEIGGATTATDLLSSGAFTASGSTTITIANQLNTTPTLATGTYNLISSTSSLTLGNFSLSNSALDSQTLSLALGNSGDNLELVVGSSSPSATTGTYTLSEAVGNNLLHIGATTTATTTLTNTGSGTADSLYYTGLGAVAGTGSITGSSGTLTSGAAVAQNGTAVVTQTYTAESTGSDTVTGAATSVTGSSTGAATLAGTNTATIFVYSGTGSWTGTTTTGSWGTAESTAPANWAANGGIPGISGAPFLTTDSAYFGTSIGTNTTTIGLNGANPYLNSITFNTGGSYNIAAGTSGTIHLDSAGTATITNTAGNDTISAPVEFDAPVTESVGSSSTLTLSGNITQSGSQSLTIAGPGTTIISGSNTYGGGTTISSGSTFITNTSGSALGSGPLLVSAGATFGGSGSAGVLSSYTIGATGSQTTLQVGNGGSDATSTLTLTATGASSIKNTNLEFNLTTSGSHNTLSVGSTSLALTNDTLTLDITTLGVIAENTPYILVAGVGGGSSNGGLGQYSGFTISGTNNQISGLGLSITGIGAPAGWYGNSYLFLVNNGSNIDDIEVEVVPEPSTWALMLGGLCTLLLIQRRKLSTNGKRKVD